MTHRQEEGKGPKIHIHSGENRSLDRSAEKRPGEGAYGRPLRKVSEVEKHGFTQGSEPNQLKRRTEMMEATYFLGGGNFGGLLAEKRRSGGSWSGPTTRKKGRVVSAS